MEGGGGCLPDARPARYFCTNYPNFNPGFSPPLEEPPKATRVDCKPSLQCMPHNTTWRISTSMCITHALANRQLVPHKCGHQYIRRDNAPETHHNL